MESLRCSLLQRTHARTQTGRDCAVLVTELQLWLFPLLCCWCGSYAVILYRFSDGCLWLFLKVMHIVTSYSVTGYDCKSNRWELAVVLRSRLEWLAARDLSYFATSVWTLCVKPDKRCLNINCIFFVMTYEGMSTRTTTVPSTKPDEQQYSPSSPRKVTVKRVRRWGG